MRLLKDYFGDKIVAGVSKDGFSQKVCPDLIIPDEMTSKLNYVNMIKQNYVCIASEGLHRSIGWKFAEYVAAGRAIVTEPLAYEVPYGFMKNQNYLEYNDVETLISACEELLFDVYKIHLMEKKNRDYYQKHLSPDKVVLDSLQIVGIM